MNAQTQRPSDRKYRPTWCANCTRTKQNTWRQANPRKDSRARVLSTYGLTIDQYNTMVHKQHNRCAICYTKIDGYLYVDHDHKTGKVRGLLCNACNTGLGQFKDDKENLLSALEYLHHAGVINDNQD